MGFDPLYLLGLDVSTSRTGIALIDEDGYLVLQEAVVFPKGISLIQKCEILRTKFYEINIRYKVQHIFCEAPKMAFAGGKSSAHVISMLNQFSGMVEWISYQVFGVEPEFVSESSARKVLGIKIPKGVKAKPVVMEWMIENEPLFSVQHTRTGSIKPVCFDICDAIVIGKYGFLERFKKTAK